jgi:hypothetical protein
MAILHDTLQYHPAVLRKTVERFQGGQSYTKEAIRYRTQFIPESVFQEAVKEHRVNGAPHTFRPQILIPGAKPL